VPDDEGQQVGDANAERRDMGGGPEPPASQVGWVEQGLVDQARLDQPIGQAEHEDRRPATPGAARHLPDEDRAAAVQQREEG
jgi:hypothetical protein